MGGQGLTTLSGAVTSPVLADLLGRPMTGVARIGLEHWRCQRFRWLALLEYSLAFVCLLCALPLVVLALLFSETDVEIPSIRTRFYQRWHQLRLVLFDARGQVVAGADFVPPDEDSGYRAVASILHAAMREQVVVVESIVQGGAREVAEVWYGGRPLLAHPDELNEERSAAVLERHGVEVTRRPDAVVVVEEGRPATGAQRLLGTLLFVACLPLLLILAFTPDGRRKLRHAWADVRGSGPPPRVVVEVRAESLCTYHARGDERWDEQIVEGADLLGITFSPALGYDPDVTRRAASLRLIGRQRSATLPLKRATAAERALRDLLLAATLRLRRERPELGLAGPGPAPTRCPFCAALYVMDPGTRCPSCGAHAGQAP